MLDVLVALNSFLLNLLHGEQLSRPTMLDKTHLSEATTTEHTKLVKIVETVAFGLDRRVLIDHGVRQ